MKSEFVVIGPERISVSSKENAFTTKETEERGSLNVYPQCDMSSDNSTTGDTGTNPVQTIKEVR